MPDFTHNSGQDCMKSINLKPKKIKAKPFFKHNPKGYIHLSCDHQHDGHNVTRLPLFLFSWIFYKRLKVFLGRKHEG